MTVKCVLHQEIKEFVYETKEERLDHIQKMVSEGWEDVGQSKRLKEGKNLLSATSDDYEWFARFQKFNS